MVDPREWREAVKEVMEKGDFDRRTWSSLLAGQPGFRDQVEAQNFLDHLYERRRAARLPRLPSADKYKSVNEIILATRPDVCKRLGVELGAGGRVILVNGNWVVLRLMDVGDLPEGEYPLREGGEEGVLIVAKFEGRTFIAATRKERKLKRREAVRK